MAKRKSTQAKAVDLRKKIESSYWWDLNPFEQLVRTEWEYLVALNIHKTPPPDPGEYSEFLEWEKECMAAEDTLEECIETRQDLISTFTIDVKEAELMAELIYKM